MEFFFRGFKMFIDWQEFELRKLTILTGQNNSGKSSLLQLLSILDQNFRESILPNLVLNRQNFSFGTQSNFFPYKDLNTFELMFEHTFENKKYIYKYYYPKTDDKEIITFGHLCIYVFYADSNKTKVNPFFILKKINDNIHLEVDTQQLIYYFDTNKDFQSINDFKKQQLKEKEISHIEELDKKILELKDKSLKHIQAGGEKEDKEYIELMNKIAELENQKNSFEIKFEPETITKFEFIDKNAKITDLAFVDSIEEKIKIYDNIHKYFHETNNSPFLDDLLKNPSQENDNDLELFYDSLKKFDELHQNYLTKNLSNIFILLENFLTFLADKINNLKKNLIYYRSLLRLQEKIYKPKDNFFTILKTFYNLDKSSKEQFHQVVNRYLKLFFKDIDNFTFNVVLVEGNYYKLLVNDRNIVEYGDGFKNLVEMLFTLILLNFFINTEFTYDPSSGNIYTSDKLFIPIYSSPKSFLIEEPELRLYPCFQSLLADLFVEMSKDFNYLIIETHSEYLIRKLQLLVSQKKIVDHDIIIFYLESNGRLRKIPIDEKGNITEKFGKGFFDESASLTIDLLKNQL